MHRAPHVISVLFGLLPLLPAQTASYQLYGSGCDQSPPLFEVVGTPKLGTTFELVIRPSHGKGTQAWTLSMLFTGFSNRSWATLPLPFDTKVLDTPRYKFCGLLYSDVQFVFVAPYLMTATTKVPFPVPNDARLLGLSIYHQAARLLGLYDNRNTRWDWYLDLSRGGHGVIGT